MANKQRGYVNVELDGEIRKLRFDTNALAELEDALGRPISQLKENNVGVREIRAMLWAGLLHNDPKLTLRGAGRLLEPDRFEEIAEKVQEAMELAFGGGKKEDEEKNVESGSSGTGNE